VPAVCVAPGPAPGPGLRNPITNIGQIAAVQQQQSFWGINTVLTQKRDQLQNASNSSSSKPSSKVTGYAPSDLDATSDALAYSDQSKKTDPFGALVVKAPAAAAATETPVWGGWVQGLGSWEHDDPLTAADVTHFTSTYAGQAGFDRTQRNVISADDALVLGIVSSWINTHTSYLNSPTTLQLVGPGVGVYSAYVKGGFSTDLTVKVDFLRMTEDFGGFAPNSAINITNAGVSGNVQNKWTGTNNNFLEPTAGFSLTHTGFGSGATALGLQDAFTLRIQTGGRLGTTWDLGHGVTVDTSLKALIYDDVIAQGTSLGVSTIGVLPSPIAPTDQGLPRGELDPEICFNLPDNYSMTVSGQVRFGYTFVGGSAAVNLRKQW
jgi:hypothetical protein